MDKYNKKRKEFKNAEKKNFKILISYLILVLKFTLNLLTRKFDRKRLLVLFLGKISRLQT